MLPDCSAVLGGERIPIPIKTHDLRPGPVHPPELALFNDGRRVSHVTLIRTACGQPFAWMWCSVRDVGNGEAAGEITMSENLNDDLVETLNEQDFVETNEFVPSSDIVLAIAISQNLRPSPSALEERDRQYELQAQQSLTAVLFGDPLPGRSALDRWRAEQERIARQSEDEED
jgi:hypothetical protein